MPKVVITITKGDCPRTKSNRKNNAPNAAHRKSARAQSYFYFVRFCFFCFLHRTQIKNRQKIFKLRTTKIIQIKKGNGNEK